MTTALERPIRAGNPSETYVTTVARVRVLEGTHPDVMVIGCNSLAAAYLVTEAMKDYLHANTGSLVGDTTLANPNEAPFVSETFQLQPPLDTAELENFGNQLIKGAFTNPAASMRPEGIMLIDSRGIFAPSRPTDDGGSVQGGNSKIAETRL